MAPRVKDETQRVRRRLAAATITSLGRASAYIRGIARRSIRKVKSGKPSDPGKPPRSPTGRLKDAIFFAVDKPRGEAVIGPTLSVVGRIGRTHEFGGQEPPKQSAGRRGTFNLRRGGHGPLRARRGRVVGVGRLATDAQVARAEAIAARLKLPPSQTGARTTRPRKYPARPFMGPALARSRDRLPNFWKNALRS